MKRYVESQDPSDEDENQEESEEKEEIQDEIACEASQMGDGNKENNVRVRESEGMENECKLVSEKLTDRIDKRKRPPDNRTIPQAHASAKKVTNRLLKSTRKLISGTWFDGRLTGVSRVGRWDVTRDAR